MIRLSHEEHGDSHPSLCEGWAPYFVLISDFLSDFALASGMAAFAGDLRRVFIVFTIGAAVFFGGHAGTRWVRAFLRLCHRESPRSDFRRTESGMQSTIGMCFLSRAKSRMGRVVFSKLRRKTAVRLLTLLPAKTSTMTRGFAADGVHVRRPS